MKIYSKKKLVIVFIYLMIALASIIVQFLKGFSVELSIIAPLLLLFAYRDLRKSFSKEAMKKEFIEDKDERNQLIHQRSHAKAFKFVMAFSISLQVALVIFYGIYKAELLIPAILTLSIIITISFASIIFSQIYFEKRL